MRRALATCRGLARQPAWRPVVKNNNRLFSSACAAALCALTALQNSLAATVTWGLLNNGFFDVAGNWVGAVAPANNDDVVINVTGLRTVTFRSPTTIEINSLAITNNILNVTSGSLTVSNAFTHTGSGGIQIAGGGTGP